VYPTRKIKAPIKAPSIPFKNALSNPIIYAFFKAKIRTVAVVAGAQMIPKPVHPELLSLSIETESVSPTFNSKLETVAVGLEKLTKADAAPSFFRTIDVALNPKETEVFVEVAEIDVLYCCPD